MATAAAQAGSTRAVSKMAAERAARLRRARAKNLNGTTRRRN